MPTLPKRVLRRVERSRHRARRLPKGPPPFTIDQILAWADHHFAQSGRWPTAKSRRIPGSLGENWRRVDSALRLGLRGLPGGSSLAQLLAENRGVRNKSELPNLRPRQILAWADAWHERTGEWPRPHSGVIP